MFSVLSGHETFMLSHKIIHVCIERKWSQQGNQEGCQEQGEGEKMEMVQMLNLQCIFVQKCMLKKPIKIM